MAWEQDKNIKAKVVNLSGCYIQASKNNVNDCCVIVVRQVIALII